MAISNVDPRSAAGLDELPTMSVVICTYTTDRWYDLERAVCSVMNQTTAPHEIVVVVDHNPELRQRVRRRFPAVTAIENRFARGLSGARNSGIEIVTGEVVAFLDDDAVAAPTWLHYLQRSYSNPDVLGVGGVAEPAWDGGRPDWFPAEFDWVVGCSHVGLPHRLAPVRNLLGANMSIRRDVLELAGGFSGHLGRIGADTAGCEETELCIRAANRDPGRFFAHEPAARVTHRVPESRSSWRYYAQRCWAEGRSKAVVSRLSTGSGTLRTERSYATRTLPAGIAKGVGDAVTRRRRGGMARAAAIVGGLTVTSAGYLRGLVEHATTASGDPPGLQ